MTRFWQFTIHSRPVRLMRRSFWGLCDQALVSLTSFLMMVLLARVLSQNDFGEFVIIYGALLFFNALQSGLFTQPHNVLGSSLSGEEYVRYTSTTLQTQLAFSMLLAILAGAGSAICSVFGWPAGQLLLAMAPAVLAWQIQEYLRRVYYTEGRVREAFFNDLISYGGQIIGIGIIWNEGALSGPVAIYVLAATSAAAGVVGLWQLRDRLILVFDMEVVRDNWRFGKWLFSANFIQSGRIQLHIMLIGALVNTTSAGLYRAAQNLVGPTHILMNAFRSVAMPRAAAIHATEGLPAMRRYLIRMAILGLIPMVLYLIAVSFSARWLMHLLYDGQYDGYAWLVWIFCIVYLLAYGGQVLTVVLSAMRISRAVLLAELATLAVGVTVGVPLMWFFGIGGAMVTDIAIGTTLIAALLHRLANRQPEPEPITAPIVDLVPVEVHARGN